MSDVFIEPLPISVGILSWNSAKSLRNTLESYKKNGLFDTVKDVAILFQESSERDKSIAREYNIPYIAMHNNIGIGNGFVTLSEQARSQYVLLLEDDWELTEDRIVTRDRLKSAIDMLEKGYSSVRLRSRKNPGFPLHSRDVYEGKELEKYDDVTDLVSPHLFESIHWIPDPETKFFGMIHKDNDYYVTTSRWSNFTNNPCLYKRDFYIDTITPFKDKGMLLEPDVSYWWARQKFKVAWGEGLFTHNDIDKYS